LTYYFFFFQAEDGIRDRNVTGVQTCALPILGHRRHRVFLFRVDKGPSLVATALGRRYSGTPTLPIGSRQCRGECPLTPARSRASSQNIEFDQEHHSRVKIVGSSMWTPSCIITVPPSVRIKIGRAHV